MSMKEKCNDDYLGNFFKLLITFFPIMFIITWTLQIQHLETFSQACWYGSNMCFEIKPSWYEWGTFLTALFLANLTKEILFTSWRKKNE